jgi:hypothetical protein
VSTGLISFIVANTSTSDDNFVVRAGGLDGTTHDANRVLHGTCVCKTPYYNTYIVLVGYLIYLQIVRTNSIETTRYLTVNIGSFIS